MTENINKILIFTEDDRYNDSVQDIIYDFRGNPARDWFVDHAYRCLPLTMGSQYAFGIKSLHTFEVEWNGGDALEDVVVTILSEDNPNQFVSSHFGMGTFTIQNRFTFTTPPGVNLMTMNPPNMYIDGLTNLNAVVETDNLKRDFTFNIRITRPHHKILVKAGQIVSAVIPTPRYFIDSFELQLATEVVSEREIAERRQMMLDFGTERNILDPDKSKGNGKRYLLGEDVWGNQFEDHQTSPLKGTKIQ